MLWRCQHTDVGVPYKNILLQSNTFFCETSELFYVAQTSRTRTLVPSGVNCSVCKQIFVCSILKNNYWTLSNQVWSNHCDSLIKNDFITISTDPPFMFDLWCLLPFEIRPPKTALVWRKSQMFLKKLSIDRRDFLCGPQIQSQLRSGSEGRLSVGFGCCRFSRQFFSKKRKLILKTVLVLTFMHDVITK